VLPKHENSAVLMGIVGKREFGSLKPEQPTSGQRTRGIGTKKQGDCELIKNRVEITGRESSH